MNSLTENPKLAGSNLVDCIPQTGKCPNDCPECFYNRAFYRTLDEPLLPDADAVNAAGRIVRVNSGHDSNLDRDLVLAATAAYKHKFYNTSIPDFDFPAPVVFTCNGRKPLFVWDLPPNVMMVRVRYTPWDLYLMDHLVRHYERQGVPVVLTWMRFYSESPIPHNQRWLYEKGTHLLNEYWKLRPEVKVLLMARYKGLGVQCCGLPWGSLCVDCGNCERFYWAAKRRMAEDGGAA